MSAQRWDCHIHCNIQFYIYIYTCVLRCVIVSLGIGMPLSTSVTSQSLRDELSQAGKPQKKQHQYFIREYYCEICTYIVHVFFLYHTIPYMHICHMCIFVIICILCQGLLDFMSASSPPRFLLLILLVLLYCDHLRPVFPAGPQPRCRRFAR